MGVLSLMPSSLKMKVAFSQYEDVMERNLVGQCRLNR
jgi:hypothetical protein